ncbi:hypothetical protein J1N35_006284, partial [Gossypium stocksii]
QKCPVLTRFKVCPVRIRPCRRRVRVGHQYDTGTRGFSPCRCFLEVHNHHPLPVTQAAGPLIRELHDGNAKFFSKMAQSITGKTSGIDKERILQKHYRRLIKSDNTIFHVCNFG